MAELTEHPREGTGKPECLRYTNTEVWSRYVDQGRRLVYEIVEERLIVLGISAYGHDGEK